MTFTIFLTKNFTLSGFNSLETLALEEKMMRSYQGLSNFLWSQDLCFCNVCNMSVDSTAEYISGGAMESDISGVYMSGLPCVTVLIGAFHRTSGQPVLGVVNQPFSQQEGQR